MPGTPISYQDLISAYANGYFPMAHPEENDTIYWHRPQMRGIIPLEDFRIPKNLKRLYRNCPFDLKVNTDFESVVRACAKRESTWISEDIINMYLELHHRDMAHSFETWDGNELVGGLYGVSLGKAFFGESMFFRKTNASKLALVFLVETLRANDFVLLDTQYLNDHLLQFGAVEVSDDEYMTLLQLALGS